MKKIYLVSDGAYSEWHIVGVFSTEEKARKYIEVRKHTTGEINDYIDEFEIDNIDMEPPEKVMFYMSHLTNEISVVNMWDPGENGVFKNSYDPHIVVEGNVMYETNGRIVVTYNENYEKMHKAAWDKYHQLRVLFEGI